MAGLKNINRNSATIQMTLYSRSLFLFVSMSFYYMVSAIDWPRVYVFARNLFGIILISIQKKIYCYILCAHSLALLFSSGWITWYFCFQVLFIFSFNHFPLNWYIIPPKSLLKSYNNTTLIAVLLMISCQQANECSVIWCNLVCFA